MLSHYRGVGSTVVGVLRVNSIKACVVTKATLGRLSGNPNVLDHFIRGNHFEATDDLWTRGRPLKLPILNDHVQGNQVRCTLRVACASVLFFRYIIFAHVMVSYLLILSYDRSCHA